MEIEKRGVCVGGVFEKRRAYVCGVCVGGSGGVGVGGRGGGGGGGGLLICTPFHVLFRICFHYDQTPGEQHGRVTDQGHFY